LNHLIEGRKIDSDNHCELVKKYTLKKSRPKKVA